MGKERKTFHVFFAILMVFLLQPGAPSSAADNPTVRSAGVSEITGTFTVIFYGGRHSADLETVAILDLEGDKYNLEPYAPDFDFSVKKGMKAEDAFSEAERFVGWHPSFMSSLLGKIIDDKGTVIGFEMRPLYRPYDYGMDDVLDIDYWRRNGTIRVTIKLKPSIERMLFRGGSDGRSSSP